MARIKISRPLVHQLPLQYLLIIPIILAISAILVLTLHGDVNTPLLYSQCSAHSRLPGISHIPILGPPACFLVSTFMFATASLRGVAQISVFLSFLAALQTVCRVESARACNQRSWNIRVPTPSWLVFNIVGGTLVWDLWIVPAFLKRAKDLRALKTKGEGVGGGDDGLGDIEQGGRRDELFDDNDTEQRVILERSFATQTEIYAIPVAVAVGLVLPSVLMLVFKDAISVIVWLFFPLWVAVVNRAVKFIAAKFLKDVDEPLYVDSHPPSVTLIYALPFIASLLAHALFIWNFFCKNDSRQMTRTALKFINIDFSFVAATVLYWVFVEAGVVPAVLMVVFSVFVGPGAALCLTWLVREKAIYAFAVADEDEESDEESDGDTSTVHEDTPLLN
ncbi:hypothetical protein F4777DRAFT_100718 [Nemania sp. FL0916]|nr:hypothetical protein F4777DRAFT_100718 [Nemania sp. FL0916]